MRVLVLDGNQNQAVAAVRSLARAGHSVLAGESTCWSKAGWSRSCKGTFQYSAPQLGAEAFVTRIADVVRRHPGTLVLPLTEATTLPISAHRDLLLAAGARLVLPSHTEVLRAFDKDETTKLAESLGIAVPKTVLVTNLAQAKYAAVSIGYPVVLKPRSSEEMSDRAVRTTGRPLYASDPAQFESAYEQMSRRSSAVLVQEYVAGEGTGYFALMRHGELRAEFAHRRIRDVYPTGSGSALRISVEPKAEIRAAALSILRALNWHGVAMVEFRALKDNPPFFIEVNGRFWHSLPLAVYAGVDFPVLLAHMVESGDIEPLTQYELGIRCRWFLGDFRHLVAVWRGPPSGFPGKYPGRLTSLRAVLTPVPGTLHDLFTWRDPLPELGDWLNFVRQVLKQKSAHGKAAC